MNIVNDDLNSKVVQSKVMVYGQYTCAKINKELTWRNRDNGQIKKNKQQKMVVTNAGNPPGKMRHGEKNNCRNWLIKPANYIYIYIYLL